MARSTSADQCDEGNIILVFTTAEEERPTYRRGILDTLCYPEGQRLHYSYRRGHIHPALLRPAALQNKKAVVVFVDVDESGAPTYFPLRRLQVLNTEPSIREASPGDLEERVIFSLSLGSFVPYESSEDKGQWHARVASFDESREFREQIPRYFVIPASDVFTGRTPPTLTAWESLVKCLSKSVKLGSAVFLSVGRLRKGDQRKSEIPLEEYKAYGPTYHVLPGNVYKLDLALYEKPTGMRQTQLTLSSSSETLQVNPPFQSVVSGLVQQTAIIACRRTVEETIAVVSIKVREPVKGRVNTPNPVFLLRIGMSRWALVHFVLLVTFGSLFLSVDMDVAREAFSSTTPAIAAVLIKLLGSGLLAWAAYIAFRKLPSGGP